VAFFSFELSNIPLCGFLHNYGLLFKTASRFFVASASLGHQSVGSIIKAQQND
jgi:hypothetical protein